MIEGCSPAVSEDRGHTSNVDGLESLAISICDVNYKLMNLKIILHAYHSLPRGHAYQPSTVELSCYVREISHCPRDGVRRQISYSTLVQSSQWPNLFPSWNFLFLGRHPTCPVVTLTLILLDHLLIQIMLIAHLSPMSLWIGTT